MPLIAHDLLGMSRVLSLFWRPIVRGIPPLYIHLAPWPIPSPLGLPCSEAFSLVELRAIAHHLGDIVDAGDKGSNADESSVDSGVGDYSGGAHGGNKRGGRVNRDGGVAWRGVHYASSEEDYDDEDDDEEWGVEYSWSAQGGAGRHQAPTLVTRMPQAICTNYLRVSVQLLSLALVHFA